MAIDRLQKIISQAGILSRRKAEELITLGQVTVNGKIAKLGDKAELGKDSIKVQGRLLVSKEAPIYLAFNKPKNVISMLGDPQGRPNLSDYLTKVHSKVYPIGRLDFGSEGLILLTNDGEFAEKVQKSEKILRVYQVKVKGHPDRAMLAKIEKGGRVEDKMIQFHSVALLEEFTSKARIQIVVEGSGASDIKAFFELKRFSVDRIVRTAIGHLTLRGLKPGSFRYLTPSQALALVTQPELGERSVQDGKVASSDRARINEAKREGVDLSKPKVVIRSGADSCGAVRIEKVRNPGILLGRPMGRTSDAAKREFEIKKSERPSIRLPQKPKKSYGAEREDRERNSFGGRDERPKAAWGGTGGSREDRPTKRTFGSGAGTDRSKRPFTPGSGDGRPGKRTFGAPSADRPSRGPRPFSGADRDEAPKKSFGAGKWGGEAPSAGARKPFAGGRDARTSSSPERPPRREFGAGYKPRGPKPNVRSDGGSDRGGFKSKRPPRR